MPFPQRGMVRDEARSGDVRGFEFILIAGRDDDHAGIV